MSRMLRLEPQDFASVKPGDLVIRWLAGEIPMVQEVTHVDDDFIYTGHWTDLDDCWRFWRTNGFEYDPDLGLPEGQICSYLRLP